MSTLAETGREAAHLLGEVVRYETRELKRAVGRPWVEGDQSALGSFGRWLGVGLAVGAVVGGIAMALYVERPWK